MSLLKEAIIELKIIEEVNSVRENAECLFNNKTIEQAIAQLAGEMEPKLNNKNPIFVCILNGGLPFSASLLKYFDFPLELDYLHLSRYQGALSGSEIKWLAKPQLSFNDRCVVLMDDILDHGISLQAAKAFCLEQGASEVYTSVLLRKEISEEKQLMNADYVGMLCPDRYVFGFGMDYKNYFRNLNGIYALKDS